MSGQSEKESGRSSGSVVVGQNKGSLCFLDKQRECGPDCKAFTLKEECRVLKDFRAISHSLRTAASWITRGTTPKVP